MFEKSIRHLFVQIIQIFLYISLGILDYLYYIFGTKSHVFLELEFFDYVLLLVELHVAWFEEMRFYCNGSWNLSLSDNPLWSPLSCVEVSKLYIFASDSNVYIKWLLCKIHKN